jgi:hypothetical protein
MIKHLATLAALIALATPANAEWRRELVPGPSDGNSKDILMVVLEDSKGEKSLHYLRQTMAPGSCSRLLRAYQEQRKAGHTVTLTIEAPPKVTGKVLHANCIRPDGTIEGDVGLPGKKI